MKTEISFLVTSARRALVLIFLSTAVLGVHRAAGQTPLMPPPFWWLSTWKFEDTNFLYWSGYAPRSSFGLQGVPSFSGNAVDISGTPALLAYNEIEVDNYTNFVCNNGMFEFWLQPHWAS